MWEKSDSWRVLVASVTFFVLVHILDVVSTQLVMAYVPGASESNPLVRDMDTSKFVLHLGMNVKAVFSLVMVALPSACLLAGTRSWIVASLIWWYWGFMLLDVPCGNLIILVVYGNFR